MRLIDLSTPVDSTFWEPDPVVHEVLTPGAGALHMSSEMKEHFGMDFDPSILPDSEFLNNDTMTLTTNTGTHVDAPSHYGSRAGYGNGTPRTIDQVPIDWFLRPAFVLDVSDAPTGTVDADRLSRALKAIDYTPAPLDIAILRTGAERHLGTPSYFTDFVGLDASATHFLLDLGIKVIGTDAFSLDAPFGHIIGRFRESGDRGVLWPAHFIGRDREFCQIERLGNLDALPSHGFRVSAFPVKIARAGAGWARAVAILEESDDHDD